MTVKKLDLRLGGVVAVAALAAAVVLVAAGCGSGTTSSAAPSPSPTKSSVVTRVLALKDYLTQVKPIADQLGSTVASLPGAVKGIGVKPGASWTAAASRLDATATRLSSAASALAALSPPAALQASQDATVKAIQSAQATITGTASFLHKKVVAAGMTSAAIQTHLAASQAKLTAASEQLVTAIQGLILSPDSTPAP